MKKFKKVVSILLVFALVFTSMVAFNAKTTEAKVKSIKVAKKVTVEVGKSKTVKVKVKATGKTSKKFTAKSSNKKVATVKVKKGKVVITGKKAGTAKVTVKSKANKKKKKTIKVTVKSSDATVKISQVRKNVFIFSFSKKVKLSPANVTAQIKQYKGGKYIQSLEVDDISSQDQKSYTVVLGLGVEIKNGATLKFTIKGVNKSAIVKEIESYYTDVDKNTTEYVTALANEDIYEETYISSITGGGYSKITKVTGVPTGMKYSVSQGYIVLQGKIANAGTYTTVINIEDEKGTKFTFKTIFVIGTASKLQIYVPKKTGSVYSDASHNMRFYSQSEIYVAGGSGEYTMTPKDKAGIFEDYVDVYSSRSFWEFDVEQAKTYSGTFEVQDDNIPSVKATGTAVVEAKKGVLVTGKVTSISGKPIPAYVYAEPKTVSDGIQNEYYDSTDSSGAYSFCVLPAKYDLYAEHIDTYSYVYNRNITSNTTLNFKLGVYKVTIKSNDSKVPANKMGDWYQGKKHIGEGESLFVKPGTYNITSNDVAIPYNYSAKASFKVSSDMTVTAQVTTTPLDVTTIASNTTVNVGDDWRYFKFIPTATGERTVELRNATGAPFGYIYDKDGNELDYFDSSSPALLIMNAYEPYYLKVRDEDGDGNTVKIAFPAG